MRHLWLLPLFLLAGCYYPYGPYYGYGGYPYNSQPYGGYAPGYYGSSAPATSYSGQEPYPAAQQPYYGNAQPYNAYPPGYYGSGAPAPSYSGQQPYPGAQQPYYANGQPAYGGPTANDPNNCGTPDEPRPCH